MGKRRKLLKNTLCLPWHLAAIFTTAKSFRANPVIGSPLLNRLGLHAARFAVSHGIFALKQRLLSFMVGRGEARAFRENGYLVLENFLPQDDFDALVRDAGDYNGEAWQCVQGDTVTWRALLDRRNLARLPAASGLLAHPRFLRLLKFCAGKNEAPILYLQQIQNGFGPGAADPQKVLHADTFHPTMKAWLFLQDVGPEDGPFTYVPGSHRCTRARLKWEYKRSCAAATLNDGYSEKGSFRIGEAELAALGLPPPKTFAVRANTLVIANTCGFHRRGDTRSGRVTRLEIWAMSRVNPFNPWPGLGIGAFTWLRDRLYLYYLRHADAEKRAVGQRASWHMAPPQPRRQAVEDMAAVKDKAA